MRKLLYGLFPLSLIWTATVTAQTNIPTGATGPAAATARRTPDSFFVAPLTYLRTYSPVKPITDPSQVNMTAAPVDVGISTQYFDSYGRTLETVDRQTSPAGSDLVALGTFDEFGNPSTQYLPFVPQTRNTNDGKFKLNAYSMDSAFYAGLIPNEKINYGQVFYDASPMNVQAKYTAPGNSWTGAGVGVSLSHRTNTVADSVRLWTIAVSTEDDVPSTAATYQPGTLTILKTIDERGDSMLKYFDALGRLILKKSQISATPSTGHAGWTCTYYVYDEMNHVRLVIPPVATAALNTSSINWNLAGNSAINTGFCYGYFYDGRGRVTMKRIPGQGKTYIAYDLFDRVVMIQDPNLRTSNQWAFLLYDAQGRPNESGLISSTLIKDSILAQAARSTSYPTLTGTYTVMSQTFYDDYSWISLTGAPLSSILVTTNINSTNFNTNYNTSPDYSQPIASSGRIRGVITGTKKIILNSSTYLYSVTLFDDHTRPIQTSATNYSGGTDVSTMQYGFSGKLLRTHIAHQKSGSNPQSHTLLTKYNYDQAGRVLSVTKNLDGTTDKIISQDSYNELGQLKTKVFGNGIETQNYSYNMRGWLLGINSAYASTPGSTSNHFGETLFYDYGFTNTQLNGNIAGVTWKGAGDGVARAYGFTYDIVNRITIADFSQYQNSSWTNSTVDYTVNGISYDVGGNLLTLRQRGLKLGASTTVDSLNYQYISNSNQLQKVTDGITDMTPLGDFKDTSISGNAYTYDANGNIITDFNRHMCSSSGGQGAVYNCLNRPDSIGINGKAGIHYYYDADGNQVYKQVNDHTGVGAAVKNYLYVGDFVYLNDTLQYVLHEEGRIRYARKINYGTGAPYYAFEYEYFLKDHLENVRTVLTENRDTSAYAATMESKDSAVVAALFGNVYTPVRTVYPKPGAFDSDTSNHNVARLNASSGVNITAGPSLVLKVMAGDQVQISTYEYYTTPVQPPPGGVNLLNSILPVLAGGVINNSQGKLLSTDMTNLSNTLSPNVTQFLNNRSYDTTKPKAYLNWILFDDQFNYVASNSGVQQVLPGSSKQVLSAPTQTISKNGFLYVYVSNESAQDVYFDNLTIQYFTGALAQEQSYYPFGLQMAGISDKQLLLQTNPYKFNAGTEFEEDYGVSYYNTQCRRYDPQIGRFTGIDGMSEAAWGTSPYHFASNNPINFSDPSGMFALASQLPITAQIALQNFEDFKTETDEAYQEQNLASLNLNNNWTSSDFGGGPYSGFWSNFNSVVYPRLADLAETQGRQDATISAPDGSGSKYVIRYNYTDPITGLPTAGVSKVNFGGPVSGMLSPASFNFKQTWPGSDQWEAGVSGLTWTISVPYWPPGSGEYVREIPFPVVYVQFPKKTWLKITYTKAEAAAISAEGFNDAIRFLYAKFQLEGATSLYLLQDYQIVNMVMDEAAAFISVKTVFSSAYVSKDFIGRSTIVSPAVWFP